MMSRCHRRTRLQPLCANFEFCVSCDDRSAIKTKWLGPDHQRQLTVSSLIRVLLEDFLPDQRRDYLWANTRAQERVPLHTRGKPYLVRYSKHARRVLMHNAVSAKSIAESDVRDTEQRGILTVNNHTVNMLAGTCECGYVHKARTREIAPLTCSVH